MFDSSRSLKLNIFTTLTFALIVLVTILIFSNISLHSNASFGQQTKHYDHDQHHLHISRQTSRFMLRIATTDDDDDNNHRRFPSPPLKETNNILKQDYFGEPSDDHAIRFDSRVRRFLGGNRTRCKVQFFMTWISPAESFRNREMLALETLFHSNPSSCLIILSKTMDSKRGIGILNPMITRGFRVRAMNPSLRDLFKNTPAQNWLEEIKNGSKNPGEIPLPQNLSNLIRLAVLYKYGGVYLDTDFIVLKDFSGLRNSIGAQSVDFSGTWTRLNNAVLVFDKNHPLVYKFIEEFASTFNGNVWGHNGPYLVSRVVERVAKTGDFDVAVLPPVAFYPVDWTRISGFFARPGDPGTMKWVEAKIRKLNGSSYGVHLWNKQSRGMKIEEGSLVWRLIYDHCVVCNLSS